MKKIFVIFTLLFTTTSLVACNQADDFAIMQEEYRKYLIETTDISEWENKTAEEIKKDLTEVPISGILTYRYTDLDYEYCYERPSDTWPALKHISWAYKITVVSTVKHDDALKDIAIKLTYFWVFNNFRNANWWNNEIGANGTLGNIAMFLYQDLNPRAQVALRARLAESSFRYRLSLLTHTGANLMDYANMTLQSSIINRDRDEFELAISRAEEEITDKNVEGFKPDGSFFQHGQQLQTTSYGLTALGIGKILRIISKTSRKFDESKLEIISRFILRGLRGISHKGYYDYMGGGRGYTRDNALSANDKMPTLSLFLKSSNFPNYNELEKYINDLKNKNSAFSGIVYFDNAKMVTMNIDDLYISFRGSDPNLTNTECVTDENCLALNLSYATSTCVMDKGGEYNNVSPLWDFSYIPGTTSLQYYPEGDDFMEEDNDKIIYGLAKAVYGDGLYEEKLPKEDNNYLYRSGYDETNNIAYFMQRSCHHQENHFTVTAIACEDGLVVLGANIEYTGSESIDYLTSKDVNTNKLHTTLQQCNALSEATLSIDKQSLTYGNAFYHTLDGQQIITKKQHVKSKAYRNRRLPDAKLGDDIEGDTFLAYIQHDNSDNAKYAYSIQPATRKDKQFVCINNFETNDKMVQEVKLPNGKVVIAPYEDVTKYPSSKGEIDLIKGQIVII